MQPHTKEMRECISFTLSSVREKTSRELFREFDIEFGHSGSGESTLGRRLVVDGRAKREKVALGASCTSTECGLEMYDSLSPDIEP